MPASQNQSVFPFPILVLDYYYFYANHSAVCVYVRESKPPMCVSLTVSIEFCLLLKKSCILFHLNIRFIVLCCAKLLQSCLILCNPMDHSPPGSSVHGILQARTLEWAAKLLFLITQIKVLQLSVI